MKLKSYIPYLGSILILLGVILIYLFLFGKNIFYTQTYSYVKNIVSPTINLELLVVSFAILLNLWMFVFAPNAKIGLISFFQKNERLRKIIKIIAIILSISIGFMIVVGIINRDWNLINEIPHLLILILIGGLALFFLFYSISPKVSNAGKFLLTPIGRIISFLASIVLTLLMVFSIEIILFHEETEVKNELSINDENIEINNPNFSISAVLSEKPTHLNSGESIPIQLKFRLTKYDSTKKAKRYPIKLDTTKQYLAKLEIQTIGFDVSELPEELKKPQLIEENKLLSWNWIVSPKENKEGTNQLIAFHLFLLNKDNGELAYSNPITSLNIKVDTPLGLPKWLISPSLSFGAILGGLIAILLPWFLENKLPKNK